MNEQILTNARLVLDDEIIDGTLVLRGETIVAIEHGRSRLPDAIDCGGDYVMPGLIELHTDNMEKYFQPRPRVAWPERQAALAHDAQMAASGITTVFDALSVGDIDDDGMRDGALTRMASALVEINARGLARVDHRLHLRCEVCHPDTLDRFLGLSETPGLGLVSLMDHSPGQRQFADISLYRTYYQGKYRLNDDAMEAFMARAINNSQRYSSEYRRRIAEVCRARNLALASHDDATVEHVSESREFGIRVAEFPTTFEAAQASHQAGMSVLMGAPNIVRGGSHSGNVAAMDLVREGLLDVLSSDYYPAALLDGIFRIARAEGGYSLPQAVACATSHAADAVGLSDRGRLALGLRGDVIRVCEMEGHPMISRVWCAGRIVH